MDRLYTAKELSAILKVTKDTIWRWGRQGKLEKITVGRTVRYRLPREGVS